MRTIILILIALVMTASIALATPVVNVGGVDYSSIDKNKTYDFIQKSNNSWDSGYDKVNIVDFILEGRIGDGDHKYTLVNGTSSAYPTDTWFANGAASFMIDEIAGYKDSNTFGYYTMGTSSPIRHELFAGSNSKGDSTAFTLSPAGEFGFYLGVPRSNNSFFYTEANLNAGHEIHAAIFQEDNSNTYILGFEDLLLKDKCGKWTTDADYQDMIVKVTIKSVPEPATMLLFGAGLAGLGLLRKRFKA